MRKIFFIIFIIIMFFSVANAWTYEEFVKFLDETKGMVTGQNANQFIASANYIIANSETIKQKALNNGYDLDNYNTFYIGRGTNYYFYFNATNTTNSYRTSSANVVYDSSTTTLTIYQLNYDPYTFRTVESTATNKTFRGWGLSDTEPTNGYGNDNIIMQNVYNFINVFNRDNLTNNNLPWYIADARVGNNYINNDIKFYINNSNLNIKKQINENITKATPYRLSQLLIGNYNELVNDTYYYITMESGDSILTKSNDFLLYWENLQPSGDTNSSGTITNVSGDKTGFIDLSGVENRIDMTNDLLLQQTQAILSGDKSLRDSIISGDKEIVNALTNTTFSGDITLESLPVIEIDDPSYNFFTWLLNNTQDAILFSGDTTLVIPLYKENYEIPSNIFVFNIEPLASFIRLSWWFVCGVPILKWVRHTIETLRSGNIPQVDDKSDLLGNVL